MKGIRARSLGYSAGVVTLVALGWILMGRAAGPGKQRISLPTDWSHRHVVFSRPATAEEYARVIDEPRFLQQMYRREMPAARLAPIADAALSTKPKPTNSMHRDWAVNLGSGASMGQGNYPAKFGFDIKTASCSADYVVYSTGLASSGSQASIVGFTNIYSGCAGSPTVNWAYDTSGQILTSPVISLDGTQVAFAQTIGGIGQLVLLKWAAASGSIGTPVTLATNLTPAQYQACPTAPCMLIITLVDNLSTTTDDTTSSPFYDYANDIIWVGGARGWVHKITGAFKGTPAEVITGGFPAQVPAASATSSAVYDSISKNVFVGDASGFVNKINPTTGVVTQSGRLDFGAGVVDAPLVDQTGGFLYVSASSDGTALCTGGVACSAVYQLSTTFTSGTGTKVTVGNSLVLGSATNPNPMYIGGLDSAYFSSANRTGNLYVCGNTGGIPTLYQIPITAGAFPVSGAGTQFSRVGRAASTAGCSPVTDVYNPNTTGGPSERIFLSVQNNGRPTACANAGCIMSLVNTPWKPGTAYAVGQQILSSTLSTETVMTAGTSGATRPAWPSSAGVQTLDGGATGVTWIDQGRLFAVNIAGWAASHAYTTTTSRVLDSFGNVEVSTTPGTSGALPPTWNTTPGGTTPDGTVVWTNVGPYVMFTLQSTGGTSGIIEDNVVTTPAGTSQVYFGTLGNQTCATSGGTGGCAVQASQPALQ